MGRFKFVTNWVAMVAILAVAILGVLAIGQSTNEKVSTQRESMVGLCLRSNEARQLANEAIESLQETREAVRGALDIAAGEAGQRQLDSVGYERLRAILDRENIAPRLDLIDCQREVPKP